MAECGKVKKEVGMYKEAVVERKKTRNFEVPQRAD
jgi:hypothetical protein